MTPAQKRLIAQMQAGEILKRRFDVWGGYSWSVEPSGAPVSRRTVEALEATGAIIRGPSVRVLSGRQVSAYRLPPTEGIALPVPSQGKAHSAVGDGPTRLKDPSQPVGKASEADG